MELSSGKAVSLRASKVAVKTFPNRVKLYLPEPAANKAEAASDDPADAEAPPESADPERDEAVEQIAALAAVALRLQAAWMRLDELASVGDPGPDRARGGPHRCNAPAVVSRALSFCPRACPQSRPHRLLNLRRRGGVRNLFIAPTRSDR